jgi:MOSC domain-containing protein YiiM
MHPLQEAYAIEALGLEGDRRCHSRPGLARQITLINAEHLELVAKWLDRSEIDPSLVRCNIVVSGVNLQALRHQHFAVGEAILLGTALCHPCSRMYENLGTGNL